MTDRPEEGTTSDETPDQIRLREREEAEVRRRLAHEAYEKKRRVASTEAEVRRRQEREDASPSESTTP